MSQTQVDTYIPKYINEDEKKVEINWIRCYGCSKQLNMDRKSYAPGIDYYCSIKCRMENMGN